MLGCGFPFLEGIQKCKKMPFHPDTGYPILSNPILSFPILSIFSCTIQSSLSRLRFCWILRNCIFLDQLTSISWRTVKNKRLFLVYFDYLTQNCYLHGLVKFWNIYQGIYVLRPYVTLWKTIKLSFIHYLLFYLLVRLWDPQNTIIFQDGKFASLETST